MKRFVTIDNITFNMDEVLYFKTFKNYRGEKKSDSLLIDTRVYLKKNDLLLYRTILEGEDYANFPKERINNYHNENMKKIESILNKKEYL